jgi:hypothetical protein
MTSARELRWFGIVVGGAFVALAAAALWRGRPIVASVFGAAGALLVVAGALAPASLRGVHGAWMAGAHRVSRVTTPVLMGVVYFGVMTPLGVALRIARRRGLSPKRGAGSYLVRRAPEERRSDLRRQF